MADGTRMPAYLAQPAQLPAPAIILLQEVFGVNAYMRSVADRLAAAGYVVVAPELFHRTAAPGLEIPYSDIATGLAYAQMLTLDGLIADLQATYAWLVAQPQVAARHIGSLGFCLGGRVSFLANAVLPLGAAASFYGGGLPALRNRAADLHAPHLFVWGGLDQHIPPAHVAEILHAVQAAGKPHLHTVISYADHGFFCDQRPSYHPDAAHEAWALTLAFFENKLRLAPTPARP